MGGMLAGKTLSKEETAAGKSRGFNVLFYYFNIDFWIFYFK